VTVYIERINGFGTQHGIELLKNLSGNVKTFAGEKLMNLTTGVDNDKPMK
jgi:hypothetical protein